MTSSPLASLNHSPLRKLSGVSTRNERGLESNRLWNNVDGGTPTTDWRLVNDVSLELQKQFTRLVQEHLTNQLLSDSTFEVTNLVIQQNGTERRH